MNLIDQQIEYYKARAPEYDQWFYRKGRFDRGEQSNQKWADEAEVVRTALLSLGNQDSVLELAPGTGIWTLELLKIGSQLTIVDASPEMLAINHSKHSSPKVKAIVADLFAWDTTEQFDLIFFSFWLSHVPREKLLPFLQRVAKNLKVGGRLFLIDSRRAEEGTSHDHVLPEAGSTVMTRKLNDGRVFDIVKIFFEQEELRGLLEQAGIEADVKITENFFIYASGVKR